MYKFFILLLIFSCCLPTFASRTVVTQNPYYRNIHSPYYNNYYAQENRFRQPYYPQRRYYNQYSNNLSELERYIYNKNFTRENELARLERLERQAFGAVQQGDFDTRYDNVRSAILSRPNINTYQKPSLLRSIGNYFSGQLTGYTPELDDNFYSYTPSNYANRRYTTYSSPWGNGYRYSDYDSGSSTGVRILD